MISIKGTGGGGGAKVFIDGVKQKKDFNFKTYHVDLSISTLPYDFYNGCAVVFNNEIHILGGKGGYTSHYIVYGKIYKEVTV